MNKEFTFGAIWQTLTAIDCRPYAEKKGGLDYLSWARAWSLLMSEYPDSDFEFSDNTVYNDGTVEVHVMVNVHNRIRRMTLPVMDHRNKAIPNPNARDVNDARMRCLVKCLALFGLGISLYGVDGLPGASEPAQATPPPLSGQQVAVLKELLGQLPGAVTANFLRALNVDNVEAVPAARYDWACTALRKKIQEKASADAKSEA